MLKKSVSEKHEIGHRLKKLRLALSETQQDMANDLNISLSHWSKIEVGAVGLGGGLLYMVSHKHGISRDWILEGGRWRRFARRSLPGTTRITATAWMKMSFANR